MDNQPVVLTDGGSSAETEERSESEEATNGRTADGEGRAEDLTADAVANDQTGSEVLMLDLRGLNLNLLGLDVSLSEVVLDVSAVEGEDNLLGNLLAAVTGLLDDGLGGLFDGLGLDFDLDIGERVSSAVERVRESVGDAVEDIPLGELLTQVLVGVVSQLLGLDDLLGDDEKSDDTDETDESDADDGSSDDESEG